jgi:hypothetical protein
MEHAPHAVAPVPRDVDTGLLIDRYLPSFDVTIREHLVIDADLDVTWRALGDLDLLRVHTPLMDAAMRVRGVPALVSSALGRSTPPPEVPSALTLAGDDVGLPGWLPLGANAPQELALGAIGRFWKPEIEWYDIRRLDPPGAAGFAAFDQPTWGRIVASFTLRPYGDHRTLASYEARTATPDPDSARRFGRYWRLVRPFVGHIMRATLEQLRVETERRARTSPSGRPAAPGDLRRGTT